MTENTPLLTPQVANVPSPSSSESQNVDTNLSTVLGSNRRWVMLSMFCCLSFLQSAVFLAWNPIANSVLTAFGSSWSASTLAWQINLATIANPFIQWPVWKAIHKFDLSRAIRWGAVFPLFLATGLQASTNFLSIPPEIYKWITFISFVLIGGVGVVFFSSISRFSSLWFPPHQRTTATGLACTFVNLGALLPAILGPLLVTDPNADPEVDPIILQAQIQTYFLVFFVLSAVLFLTFLVYFPSEKKLAVVDAGPHLNQAELPLSVARSLLALLRRCNVVLIMLVYSLSSLTHVWGSTLLTLTLAPLKISQASIGLMITASILVSAGLTMSLSRLADVCFRGRLKTLLMFLLPFHALAMIAFTVTILLADQSNNQEVLISILYVVIIASLNSGTPLLFELGCEMSHPVSEEIVSGSFDQMVNAFSIGFHALFTYISSIGNNFDAILYILMALPCITVLLFSCVNEEYRRMKAETTTTPSHPEALSDSPAQA